MPFSHNQAKATWMQTPRHGSCSRQKSRAEVRHVLQSCLGSTSSMASSAIEGGPSGEKNPSKPDGRFGARIKNNQKDDVDIHTRHLRLTLPPTLVDVGVDRAADSAPTDCWFSCERTKMIATTYSKQTRNNQTGSITGNLLAEYATKL